MTWDRERPLARIKGETKKANAALRDYARLGAGRSLAILWRSYHDQPMTGQLPPTRNHGTLKNWSAAHSWVARVERWDKLESEKEDQKWRERRDQWREDLFDLSTVRGQKALKAMLDYPLFEETVEATDEEGRPIVYKIEPVNWNMLHAARLLAEVTKSAALVLGEPTERTEQKVSGGLDLEMEITEIKSLEDDELDDRIGQISILLSTPGPGEISEPDFRKAQEATPESNGSAPG